MKRSCHEISTNSYQQKISDKSLADQNAVPKFMPQKVRVNSAGDAAYTLDSLPKDMVHLGGEMFVKVCGFFGQTRVHIRRHVRDNEGFFHPTKDGISLSPSVWFSLCAEINHILNHRSSDKVFVIDRDLCVSKQMKDGFQLFVFQRLFQRKNLSMQFVQDSVVLRGQEIWKLDDIKNFITDCVKDALINYSLSYHIAFEIEHRKLDLKPSDCDGFLQLCESLGQCLCNFISLKITELINCFGCSDNFPAGFMHDCMSKSRVEKYNEYFDQAIFRINMKDLAKNIVEKNLNVDFDYVIGQQEFFDAVDTKGLFKSVEKMYVEPDSKNNECDAEIC